MDMTGISVLMSDEANNEAAAHLNDPLSMVNARGKLVRNISSDRLAKFTFFCMTYHDLEQGKQK